MDRSLGTEAAKTQLENEPLITLVQNRRAWFAQLLGCETKSQFKYYKYEEDKRIQFANSLEDSNCFLRLCCSACRPFTTQVKTEEDDAEIIRVDRPCAVCVLPLKCCDGCKQVQTISSGGDKLGSVKEEFFCCVPRFTIYDDKDEPMYLLHQPTCVGGMCVYCCAEGNPCGKGCCKAGFHVFPMEQKGNTDGTDAKRIGRILKKPRGVLTEIFTDSVVMDIEFPEDSTSEQKAVLMGTALFINANFFEGNNDD